MTNKLFVPVATMLAGVLVWVALLVLHEVSGGTNGRSLWLGAGLCLAAGALVVFSGVRCRQVGGPRLGNIVRTILLIAFAAVTCWRVGIIPAGVLVAGAIATGVLALTDTGRPKAAGDSNSASAPRPAR
jgi:hypothetical protein